MTTPDHRDQNSPFRATHLYFREIVKAIGHTAVDRVTAITIYLDYITELAKPFSCERLNLNNLWHVLVPSSDT